MIKIVVGLGNPGQQYHRTRHNVGFWFVDSLAVQENIEWQLSKKYNAQIASVNLPCGVVTLLKPMTYMNKSGSSVASYMRYNAIAADELLVIHDELDFLPGTVKLKKEGGHAGHNGLRDIIAQLNSNQFLRMRIGIGRPIGRQSVADFVLTAPAQEDREKIEQACNSILSEFGLLFEKDINYVMNRLHA